MVNLAAKIGDAEMVRLRIESQTRWNTRMNVYLGDSDAVVMTAKRDLYRFRTEWWVAVAKGFDLSLVSGCLYLIPSYTYSDAKISAGHCASRVYLYC